MRDDQNDLWQLGRMLAIRLAISALVLWLAYRHALTLLPFAAVVVAVLMAKPLLELLPAMIGRMRAAAYQDADHWIAYGGFEVRIYRDERGGWWFDAADICRLIDRRWPPDAEAAALAPMQRGRPVLSETSVHQLLGGSGHPLARRLDGWFEREMKALRKQPSPPPASSTDAQD
ncbi:hypothetical protein SAMN02745857_03285 [Andreprevotia lacus DSM 23236]|jgi:hypothetical protein|uniref:Uncharacterized protein n=1 Tax=Andreprevotia lacus DSM 23236 TaxID=1121001 RepID=A0A1W1XXC3_9NEIS|nr:hypothetical protein [Andreprevotia lacus]SMC28515.1 hypothetical protein SAMN02745857_03285 [Andreprevotia lacus DSM 23236]